MEELSLALQDYKDADDNIIELFELYAELLENLAAETSGVDKTHAVASSIEAITEQMENVAEILENRISQIQPIIPLVRQSTYNERLNVELSRFLEKLTQNGE